MTTAHTQTESDTKTQLFCTALIIIAAAGGHVTSQHTSVRDVTLSGDQTLTDVVKVLRPARRRI